MRGRVLHARTARKGRGRLTAGAALALLAGAILATPAPAAGQQTHLVVVVGLGGDDDHRQQFHERAVRLVDAALDRYGLPADNVHYLGEDPDLDPTRIKARSDREGLESTVRALAGRVGPSDAVVIVLIGHGSARGTEARFNLPGPDLGPAEFALLLDQLPAGRVAFVNTAASSGGFLAELAGENRTVVAATRSAREQNETVFGEFFVEAYAGDDADLDKDGRVSLLEAFAYASRETRRHYDEQGLMLTEHAVLDDDGDGEGIDEPAPPDTEGRYAAALYLSAAPSAALVADAPPELQALYQRRDSLQAVVRDLQAVEGTLAADEYEARLEALLVELGLLTREIRALEQGGER